MSILLLNKFFIETTSPLALHSGSRDAGFDSQIAKDWNELPYIPATSITGAWRALALELYKSKLITKEVSEWFGNAKGIGKASKITITDALILNDHSELITDKLLLDDELAADNILSKDVSFNRDRCRVTHRGVAADQGKFDIAVIPVGVRFEFEVSTLADTDQDIVDFNKLLNLLSEQGLRFGSNKTVGLGSFKIIDKVSSEIDLTKGGDFVASEIKRFRSLKLLNSSIGSTNSIYVELASIPMVGVDSWSIGSGDRSISANYSDKNASFCYSEKYLKWDKNILVEGDHRRVVVCGSMLKGILAHRIIYHYCRLSKIYAYDNDTPLESDYMQDDTQIDLTSEKFKDLTSLLGFTKDSDAKIGALIVDEALVGDCSDLTTFMRSHNKVDYFTGGVIPGALFSEERIYKPKFNFRVLVKKDVLPQLSSEVKQAVLATLLDLKEGFLPIAAGSGREAGLLELIDEAKCVINSDVLK